MSQNDNRLPVLFQAGVLERIRRHARSSMDAEVCGVLIGRIADGQVVVEASIEGDHAAQGGTSVTFTQETWSIFTASRINSSPTRRSWAGITHTPASESSFPNTTPSSTKTSFPWCTSLHGFTILTPTRKGASCGTRGNWDVSTRLWSKT